MPKRSLYTLIWSQQDQTYEMYTDGMRQHPFALDDAEAWWNWLETCTSFSFQGQQGHLHLLKEGRVRGSGYWYAYAYTGQRKSKRYLGPTRSVTLTHLEEAAFRLAHPSNATATPTASASISAPGVALSSADTSTHLPGALLLSKLLPPRLPTNLVRRGSLLDKLDQIFSHRLCLLSASAGSGKTTLLSAWMTHAAASSHAVAWLALDEMDSDPTHFWVSLILALRSCWPGIGETALEMLHSPQPPQLSTILVALLNDLMGRGEQITLILDDYHLIEDPSVHTAMLFWLNHAPGHVHLILASRVDPPLTLARFRLRGQMFELRDADLRFQQNEVNQFLTTTMGLFLSEEEVMLLEQRTEGWIAGLQLAALALQQRKDHLAFVQTFTGNQRYLFDYIQEEILAHLEASVQGFLLQTSVLTRLHADLCQAVIATLDVPSCQAQLERLERANLFLIPLDEERGWYRFHDLFREALLTRLHATQPARLAQLHQHAAHWYEQHGEIREAIVHLLAAQDFSSAATLMERVAEEFWLRGEIQLLHYWIMALPNGVIREHARFVLTAALYLINTSAHTVEMQVRRTCKQAENMIERVEEAALLTDRWCVQEQPHENDVLPAPEVALLRRRVRLLRLWSKANEAEMNDDWEQHLSIDRQLQQEEQEDEILWQMISLSAAFIDAFSFQGKGARLLPKLVEARQQADRSGNRFVILKVRQWVALTSLQAGQIRLAYQQSREALDLLEQMEGDVLLAGYFFFCQAIALYHWNRLAEARSVLQKMIHDATIWQRVDLLRCGYIILAELAMAAEDMLAAAQALHEVERLQHHGSLTPFDQSWSMIVRVRWWLARGDLTEARNWAERVLLQSDSWGANALLEFPMLLRIHGAQKQWAQARELLSRFSGDLDRSEDIQDLLPFLACSFVTLHHSGEGKQARTVATRLLALTAPEGLLRVFLDEGEPMRQALLALLTTPQADEAGLSPLLLAYVSHVLAAFEQEEQQRKLPLGSPSLKTEKDLSHTAQPIASTSERVEPLSVREVEVLQLLSTGASNQAIADQLVISLTTAKKHVSRVLMKLGVENRTQAVVRARELSLL